jgi:hypothetical protein
MIRITGLFLTTLTIFYFSISGRAITAIQEDEQTPLLLNELAPELDGDEVTVKFTVAGLDGVAQLSIPGQAPSFAIETEKGKQNNQLSVWIEGELANVLDRLEMSAFQENSLKTGTVIVATGKLTAHRSNPDLYFLKINRWQDFRILPSKPKQQR